MPKQRYASESEKADGAVFPLKDRKNDKQPEYTGKIEISRSMLKSMVNIVKEGDPLAVRVAVWPHQTGQNPPHNPYRFVKMEVLYPKVEEEEVAVPDVDPEDDMPW